MNTLYIYAEAVLRVGLLLCAVSMVFLLFLIVIDYIYAFKIKKNTAAIVADLRKIKGVRAAFRNKSYNAKRHIIYVIAEQHSDLDISDLIEIEDLYKKNNLEIKVRASQKRNIDTILFNYERLF
ncbi:MAG: hypothetical protein Q8P20_00335 [bacterium]|nr:hypothetical protein [bacterium]